MLPQPHDRWLQTIDAANLLAWRKRIRRGRPAELYHGATIPLFRVKDPKHREVRDMVRAHHDKKRAIKKEA